MPFVNFREVRDRFGHIDGEFVDSSVAFPAREARFRVRFYPWREHPLLKAAVEQDRPWRINNHGEGKITATVVAHHVFEARLSQSAGEITECWFTDEHPLLLEYCRRYQILCTSPLVAHQVTAIIDLVRAEVRHDDNPYRFLNVPSETTAFYEWAASGVWTLGNFPTPLYRKVIAYLDSIGARYMGTGEVEDDTNFPVLFMTDEGDYIIAADFEVELPEAVHKSEWFSES